MSLGKRLRQMRIQQGYTQRQLAELVGCSQQSINAIERNESTQPRKLNQIATHLRVAPEWLQYGSSDRTTTATTIPAVSGVHLVPTIEWSSVSEHLKSGSKTSSNHNLVPIPVKFSQKSFVLSITNSTLLNKLGIQLTMELHTGIMIVVDPEKQPNNNCYMVAHSNLENTALLYQYNKTNNTESLTALGIDDHTESLPSNNIKIAGVVVHICIDLETGTCQIINS